MRRAARLLAVAGAVAVGWLLFGEGPRDVVLVYDLAGAPAASALEVRLRRGGQEVRRAEFRLHEPAGPIRHEVRLPDGDYALGWRLLTPAGPREGERAIAIREDGTIVLAIGR